jgi:hypothetical protein
MLAKLKRSWRELAHGRPGHRFRDYQQARRGGRPAWRRIVSIVAGVLLVLVGIVALPAPGPGTLVIVLGAALLAREFPRVASFMDGLERFLRRAWTRLKRRFAR